MAPSGLWYPVNLTGTIVYRIHADWDREAKVWAATSHDVPGLATEAPTVEALTEKLRIMIPELLEANQLLSGDQPDAIAFELTSHRQEKIPLTLEYLRAKLDELLQSWIQDGDAQEQKETGELLVQALDEDRLSDRPLFPPELKGVTW